MERVRHARTGEAGCQRRASEPIRRAVVGFVAIAWTSLWIAGLVAVAGPWRDLGGIVSERLRWLHRFVLLAALWLGLGAARIAVGLQRERGTAWPSLMRPVLYPPAFVAATTMLALVLAGRSDPVGVVLTALVAYFTGAWCGLVQPIRDGLEARGRPCASPPRPRSHRVAPGRPTSDRDGPRPVHSAGDSRRPPGSADDT
jgi:hypothetical protein